MTRKNAGKLMRELGVPLIVILAAAANADTRHVPGEYGTIQAAINATWPGDIVEVADGVYRGLGNIELNYLGRDITVRSANGPDNCRIDCERQGRAVWFRTNETPDAVLDGFTIRLGSAEGGGAVLVESRSNPTIRNCVFDFNEATVGGAIQCIESSPSITGCTFANNRSLAAGWAGAMDLVQGSDPIVTDCVFRNNRSVNFSGAVDIWQSCNPVFIRCTFESNISGGRGGAIWASGSCFPTFTDCVFMFNQAGGSGGALRVDEGGATVINCVFARNSSLVDGGAIRNSNSDLEVINCTFFSNNARFRGGAVYGNSFFQSVTPSVTLLANCVLRGNIAPDGSQIAMRIDDLSLFPPVLTVSHSSVQGGRDDISVQPGVQVNWLEGNISLAPQFVNRNANDYRLKPKSPCIDAGNSDDVPPGVTTDLGGKPRFVDDPDTTNCQWEPGTCGEPPHVDMGAHEFQGACDPCDANCDGDVDAFDIEPFLELLFGGGEPCDTCTGDVNGDGIVDAFDIEPFLNCLFP